MQDGTSLLSVMEYVEERLVGQRSLAELNRFGRLVRASSEALGIPGQHGSSPGIGYCLLYPERLLDRVRKEMWPAARARTIAECGLRNAER